MIGRLRGVTLIELMVVSIITIMVSAGLFTLLYRSWMNHDVILTQNLVQREARTALDVVCDELRTISKWDYTNIALTTYNGNSALGQKCPNNSSSDGFKIYLESGKL